MDRLELDCPWLCVLSNDLNGYPYLPNKPGPFHTPKSPTGGFICSNKHFKFVLGTQVGPHMSCTDLPCLDMNCNMLQYIYI